LGVKIKIVYVKKEINTNFLKKKQYLCHCKFAEHTFEISALNNLCAISIGTLAIVHETFMSHKNIETQMRRTKKIPLHHLGV
jgi:hypothetical protein